MPEPLGSSINMTAFVDANHAGNVVTRRSHTGIIIYLQNTPIVWHSCRQNTVETSTFGSEFVALRCARDLIVALRYKLRMFGVPMEGHTKVLCDNQGVVKNASIPESVLSKKHNAINYHAKVAESPFFVLFFTIFRFRLATPRFLGFYGFPWNNFFYYS
jgi:hypothetical protein